jgi:hypothetical protein
MTSQPQWRHIVVGCNQNNDIKNKIMSHTLLRHIHHDVKRHDIIITRTSHVKDILISNVPWIPPHDQRMACKAALEPNHYRWEGGVNTAIGKRGPHTYTRCSPHTQYSFLENRYNFTQVFGKSCEEVIYAQVNNAVVKLHMYSNARYLTKIQIFREKYSTWGGLLHLF